MIQRKMNSSRFLLCFCTVAFYADKVWSSKISDEKALLREKMTAILRNMTEEERKAESDLAILKLLHLPTFHGCERVGVYLNTELEVQTEKLIRHILGKGHRCFVPRINDTTMDMVLLRSMDDYNALPVNEFGFKEPDRNDWSRENGLVKAAVIRVLLDIALQHYVPSPSVTHCCPKLPHQGSCVFTFGTIGLGGMDVIIIPGLAFTLRGDRLGRGRGIYDRYITSIRPRHNPALIGLAFTRQILKEIPRADYDIKVDTVMTAKYGQTAALTSEFD